ncbi:MAG TPA: polysaccharide deacetylase family protein [candidate division Zixibacteria bacterium]|nr:polysaccharide deacetylase family protein [candidate division Zixibacteria bacterium]
MDHRRYDYSPIFARPKIEWPGGARIALWVAPNIEYFHFDMPIRGSGSARVPDVPGYTLRDYGSRVGVFRIMEVLDRHGIRASVLLNAEVCERHPPIIEQGNRRGWEWLGHGLTNSVSMADYPADQEREVIHRVKEIIASATGKPPKGWLGPGLGETFDTPDHLAAEGFEYVCDWGCDEQPVPMRVKSGRMIVVPYELGINDIRVFLRENRSAEEYCRMVCDQFDTLYRDSRNGGRVLCLPLHPFVIGIPHRIQYLDRALEYICSHEGVWRATGWEIADWYYRHYYEDPGRHRG